MPGEPETARRKTATPSKITGKCKLCLRKTNLCDSHLIAAAFYRTLLSDTVTPRDPLLITSTSTYTSSRQVSDYVFCVECEDRFRKGGEDWVIRHAYRGGQEFLLRDLVRRGMLLDDGKSGKIYATRTVSEINQAALIYFAASIFWRSSVHSWRYEGRELDRVRLGSYQEEFRQFLLGDSLFPSTAALVVWVSEYEKPSRAITTPHTRRVEDFYLHSFDIPGIRFDLFVGKTIPDFVRRICIVKDEERPIFLSELPDDVLAAHVDLVSKTTRLSPRLQRIGKWAWNISRGR